MTTSPPGHPAARQQAGSPRDDARLLLSLFEFAPGPNVALDPADYRILAVSNDYLALTRRRREDLVGEIFFDAFPDDPAHPEDRGSANLQASFERVKRSLQRDAMAVQRHPIRNLDTGKLEERFWSPLNAPVLDADGKLVLLLHSTEDVTGQKQSEEDLRRARTLERIAGVTARVGGWMVELEGPRSVTWAPEIYAMYEWEGSEPPDIAMLLEQLQPASRQQLARASADCEYRGIPFDIEMEVVSFKGTPKWLRIVSEPELNAQGNVVRMVGAVQDITHQKATQARIAASEERLRHVIEAALDVVWDIDLVQRTRWCNDGIRKFGYDPGDQVMDMEVWASRMHPDDLASFTPELEQMLADPTASQWRSSYRFLTASGKWVHLEDRSYILRDEQGKPVRMIGGSTDVTKRLEMEEQLLQTQRLDALGQLTGGIAHDFNNLLTVILGNTELLQEELQQHRLLELTNNIDMAATRGANLTRQLLAFSRKQALQPTSLDINQLLTNFKGMLLRTLGEHILIKLKLQQGLWLGYVDASQLEVALLNLCINARDAMPEGGTLTMETGNVTLDDSFSACHAEVVPGDYVCISITDTGIGIPAEVLDRVFEPFFTTKEKNKGTGLGLSMVFGFVKQSNGHINVYSEVGLGTTIRLYLPCSRSGITPVVEAAKTIEGGSELVLLVEDNDLVRELSQDLLRSLGYQVLSAGDGEAALTILQHNRSIDLLLTDVVMPGMGGPELAERATLLQPGLKVLYASGYTQDSMMHDGKLDADVHLLAKPYSKTDLAKKLREVLDARVEP